jgi:hypothetical protein
MNKKRKSFFHKSWQKIHLIYRLEPYKQLEIFFKILLKFENNSCLCGNDAYVIFKNLFNNNIKNFFKIKNYKEFWIFFHNLINLKLNKKVFLTN